MTPYKYDPPHALLDNVKAALNLKTNAALADALEVAPPHVSRLRHGRLPVGPTILIKVHELTGWSFTAMREMLKTDKS